LVLVLGAVYDMSRRIFVHVRSGMADAVATATCDILLRLLPASELRDVWIQGRENEVSTPLSGAGLTWSISLFPREPKLSSPSFVALTGLERRPVSCICDHVTT
jgi:hypothetical protein